MNSILNGIYLNKQISKALENKIIFIVFLILIKFLILNNRSTFTLFSSQANIRFIIINCI